MIKRFFDLFLALIATIMLALPLLLTALCVKLTSRGPVVYWSNRVGRDNVIFKMPKFRSMKIDTPAVATHLLTNPDQYLTPIGSFIRKSSLDELPIPVKVELDAYYLQHQSLWLDIRILWMTFFKVVRRDGITH